MFLSAMKKVRAYSLFNSDR